MKKNKKIKANDRNLICSFFHPIQTLARTHFVDKVTGKSVGKFYCPECDNTFLAEHKHAWFRVNV